MKFFKPFLIVVLSVIMVFMGMIVVKLYYSNSGGGFLQFSNYSVICVLNKRAHETDSYYDGEPAKGYSAFDPSIKYISYFDKIKGFIRSHKHKLIYLNDSTLKLSNFPNKEEATSFIIEIKQYYGDRISKCYVDE